MNYANSWQLAYNIGDNQQLAYAALKTIRRGCSPTPMLARLGLMYRSRPASIQGDLITCRISMLITAASPRCTAAPQGEGKHRGGEAGRLNSSVLGFCGGVDLGASSSWVSEVQARGGGFTRLGLMEKGHRSPLSVRELRSEPFSVEGRHEPRSLLTLSLVLTCYTRLQSVKHLNTFNTSTIQTQMLSCVLHMNLICMHPSLEELREKQRPPPAFLLGQRGIPIVVLGTGLLPA